MLSKSLSYVQTVRGRRGNTFSSRTAQKCSYCPTHWIEFGLPIWKIQNYFISCHLLMPLHTNRFKMWHEPPHFFTFCYLWCLKSKMTRWLSPRDEMCRYLWNLRIFRWEICYVLWTCSNTPGRTHSQPHSPLTLRAEHVRNEFRVTMSRSTSTLTQKSYQQRSTLPASVPFNKVMSLRGDIQTAVGRKPHGSHLIKQTFNVVKRPLIYKSHLGTQQNGRPLFIHWHNVEFWL